MSSSNFIISIVGRTNVGKSTLFNRLAKSRDAIVYNRSSVTRDIKSIETQILGKQCILQDTPGLFDELDIKDEHLRSVVHKNIERTISNSNLLLFVIDSVSGICQNDYEIARLLRKYNIPVIVVCNKCDSTQTASGVNGESFGFKKVIYISAEHNIGICDLEILIQSMIPKENNREDSADEDEINVAIVGRPNVGKSTMINTIIREDKQLVSDYAGLTRDVAKYKIKFEGHNICIIDTPGIRRNTNIHENLEFLSASFTRKTFEYADVIILMIDATTLESGRIDKTDYMLANEIIESGKAILIAFNKVDKTPYKYNEAPKFIKLLFMKNLYQLKNISFLFVSAKQRVNIKKMLFTAIAINKKQEIKIPTSKLNTWLRQTIQHEFMQSFGSKFKLKYITQVGTKPLKFIIFGSTLKNMRLDHERFIANRFRESFAIYDVPLRFFFREKK